MNALDLVLELSAVVCFAPDVSIQVKVVFTVMLVCLNLSTTRELVLYRLFFGLADFFFFCNKPSYIPNFG